MSDLSNLLPELILVLVIFFLIISEVTYRRERTRLIFGVALFGVLSALLRVVTFYGGDFHKGFSGVISIDGIALFLKIACLILTVPILFFGYRSEEIEERRRVEFLILTLTCLLALLMISSASEMTLLFLGIQVLNVCCALLVGLAKDRSGSMQSVSRLISMNILSFTFFGLGLSLLFLVSGSVMIDELLKLFGSSASLSSLANVGLVLILFSALFQLLVFPLNLWFVDSFEGAPSPVSALLAVFLPMSGIVVLLRFFYPLLKDIPAWSEAFSVMLIITVLFGAIAAAVQTSTKRMIGFLSITHLAMLYLGFVFLSESSLAMLLFGFVVFSLSVVGTVWSHSGLLSIQKSLHGAFRNSSIEAVLLTFFLAALVGMPPFPGFLSSFLLSAEATRSGFTLLVASSHVAQLIVFVTFVKIVHLQTKSSGEGSYSSGSLLNPGLTWNRTCLLFLGVPLLLLVFFAEGFVQWAAHSIGFILW